ncbi:hypothetical protein VKT23_010860 [Stygiomarasmius scandens]|uniref:DUF6534 domain-containing protein n=1 Tax=Marasmiellus scandens TaxID=2682957 RepID=A0ABR1JB20_9AGAR
MEFVQTIIVTNDAFHTYASGFGDYEALSSMHLNWFSVPVMSGLAFTATVAGLLTGVYAKKAGEITNLHQVSISVAIGIYCGFSALCDVFIAICMTYILSKNAKNSFRKTKLLLTRLIRITIETGSITAIVASLTLILVISFPDQTYYTTPSLIIPKLYANTLLVILNSRFRIVGGRDDEDYSNMTSIEFRLSQPAQDNGRTSRNSGVVLDLQRVDSLPQPLQGTPLYDKISPENTSHLSKSHFSQAGSEALSMQTQLRVVRDAEQTA